MSSGTPRCGDEDLDASAVVVGGDVFNSMMLACVTHGYSP